MKKYRIIEYKTIRGRFEFVDLGDHSYGEWIVYENNKPKYHVNVLRENSQSDIEIKKMIKASGLNFEEILIQIGIENQIELNLGKKPTFALRIKSELRELNLLPMPIGLMKK